MSNMEVRRWVEANPGRVNDRDGTGYTPLFVAASELQSLSLVVWLLDEKGADVNVIGSEGNTPLHVAASLDILMALLDRGADTTRINRQTWSPLMRQAFYGTADAVARLLQDPRVRATIDVQDANGSTALHCACACGRPNTTALNVHSLLQAGADPTLTRRNGLTPVALLRQINPESHAAIALLEQALAEAEKASLLIKARRLAVAATSHIVASSCLQQRVAQGQPLPRVALMPLTDGQNEDEEGRKLRTTLSFLTGLGREAMSRDVFRVVMDFLMPSWDPLRRKNAGAGQPLEQG